MKKIFLESGPFKVGMEIEIFRSKDSDYHHIVNVLRTKIGEEFIISDGFGNEFFSTVSYIDKSYLRLKLDEKYIRKMISLPKISLYFSVLKSENSELIIRKGTEIGVNKFIPVITKNTIVKLDGKQDKKLLRWNKIAKEASMQCGRSSIPEIHKVLTLKEIVKFSANEDSIFGYYDDDSKPLYNKLDEITDCKEINVLIGPEGDFTSNEVVMLKESGWQSILLSPHILKSETAALFAISAICAYSFR